MKNRVIATVLGSMALAVSAVALSDAPSWSQDPRDPKYKKASDLKLTPVKIKTDAKHFKTPTAHSTVDWSYLRMNRPQVITGVVASVQANKLKRSTLIGAADPKVLDAMLKTSWVGWMPETLTAKEWKPRVKLDPKQRFIGDYSADQMKSAKWASILENTKTVSRPKQDFTLYATHSPEKIDFGSGLAHTRSAVVTVTSPTAGQVKASWGAGNKEAFSIKSLTSYTGTLTNGQPTVDKTVSGTGALTVKAGQDYIVEIEFNSPKHGDFTETLQIRGHLYSVDVPVKVHVTPDPPILQSVTITPDKALINLVPGGYVLVGAKIKSVGAATPEAVVEGISLPTGISMEPVKVKGLLKNEERNVTLKFTADPLALEKSDIRMSAPGTVRVTWGKSVTDRFFQFTVRQASWVWDTGYVNITDSVEWGSWLWINSDGAYHWHAHLKDTSTVSGDSFVVGWYINFNLDGVPVAMMEKGKLGSKWFGGATDAYIDKKGVNPNLGKYWPQIYDGNNVTFFANANADWSGVVDWAIATGLEALMAAAGGG